MERLPLFPLKTVLFPGAAMPLHIFEERYRLMIGRCIEKKLPFGVVLIRSGEEVGATAEPHDVGTTARIVRAQRLPDGRMNVIGHGDRRFRIVSLDHSEPYLAGDVRYLEDERADGGEAQELAGGVASLYGEQFRLLLAVTGQWFSKAGLPSEPALLADYIASQLELPAAVKQRVLETLDVPDRLRAVADLVGDSIRELTERWEEQRERKFSGAALN